MGFTAGVLVGVGGMLAVLIALVFLEELVAMLREAGCRRCQRRR